MSFTAIADKSGTFLFFLKKKITIVGPKNRLLFKTAHLNGSSSFFLMKWKHFFISIILNKDKNAGQCVDALTCARSYNHRLMSFSFQFFGLPLWIYEISILGSTGSWLDAHIYLHKPLALGLLKINHCSSVLPNGKYFLFLFWFWNWHGLSSFKYFLLVFFQS